MTSSSSDKRRSTSDVARDQAALREVWPPLLVLLVLQGSLVVLDPDGRSSALHLLWSFSPLIPAAWLACTQVHGVRRADEYQRLVQLQALAIGFGVTILVALAGGLADAAGVGSASQSLQITFLAGVVAWIAALAIGSRAA